jgi:exodeoxyribonuclease V beta subunit
MTEVRHFDLLDSPLEGTNLIEASAGTGKTYTITGLFLRLLVEKDLSPDRILVVTFTEAATGELRERIRAALRDGVAAFSGGPCTDSFLHHLAERHGNPKAALRCLREALRDFDQAAIFTIHGFCRKVLYENAFESGSLFDTELITDQTELKREIVHDFWRRHFYTASPLFVNHAMDRSWSPQGLLLLLGNRSSLPFLRIIPQVPLPDTSQPEAAYLEAFHAVSAVWRTAREEVESILVTHPGLNRVQYARTKIPLLIQAMDRYVSDQGQNLGLFKGVSKLSGRALRGSVKSGHLPPEHPLFDCCDTLRQRQGDLEKVFDQTLLAMKTRLFSYAEKELSKRKRERNIQFFDDLLLNLHESLEGKGGQALSRSIRMKFRAALVDEFQDTDPVQYAVFRRVFAVAEDPVLFFIGDPKQAIYSFRGADVFAYMAASGHVKSRYTLRENWRSVPQLITAINALFSGAQRPFVFEKIPFEPAVPASAQDSEILTIEGRSRPPLNLWFTPGDRTEGPDRPITKTEAGRQIPDAVSAEIARLLGLGRNRKALLGTRPLRESDLAVLVRTNAQARRMQEALSDRQIPCVLYSTGDLFDTQEALEVERVLAGIVEPNNERALRAALTTPLFGIGGKDLLALMEDDTAWEIWAVLFRDYQRTWLEEGFIRMFRGLLFRENVLARLMALPDGERRTTNVLHLSEVLHQASVEKRLGMPDLLRWLIERRESRTPGSEEYPLRLESDENAVRLITIHKSKGLEYPVVFCPFLWDGSKLKRPKEPLMFHDPDHDGILTLDLGSQDVDKNRISAEKELLAENLRLLYVALTRAKNLCYLLWGRFNDADTSALAYLLHQPVPLPPDDVVDATGERFLNLTANDLRSELETTRKRAEGTIHISGMPSGPAEPYPSTPGEAGILTCREFSGKIDRQWRISSFSSLVSGLPHGEEMADRDAVHLQTGPDERDLDPLVPRDPWDIFSFPRGTHAGTCLHDIFEHLDFTETRSDDIDALVVEKLEAYGFESRWQDPIRDMILRVLSTPLDPISPDLRLSRIRNKDRLNEMEFYFPLRSISTEKLMGMFRAPPEEEDLSSLPEVMGRLQFAPTQGFMKGFMDLVFEWKNRFYLVDWKSNYLGDRVEDYRQESLTQVMKKECYILQYLLYAVALDQYLRLRMTGYRYEAHFGGIFYIFLRGVDPSQGPDSGIYRDRPSPHKIHTLREHLIGSQ